jgi:hypothetical protein
MCGYMLLLGLRCVTEQPRPDLLPNNRGALLPVGSQPTCVQLREICCSPQPTYAQMLQHKPSTPNRTVPLGEPFSNAHVLFDTTTSSASANTPVRPDHAGPALKQLLAAA